MDKNPYSFNSSPVPLSKSLRVLSSDVVKIH